jgi:hypothetical protein
MDRYSILLGKTPPPRPKVKKPEKIITRSTERASSRGTIIPAAQRNDLISQYMATAEGRARLAASMVQPLRERLSYQSVARRIFQVDPLPDGALPVYDKDTDVPGYVLGERDQEVSEIPPEEHQIHVPMFEILSRPSIPLSSVRQRRFNLIERSQDLAVAEIGSQEIVSSLTLLDAVTRASSSNIITPDFTTARITHTAFMDSYALIERHDLRVGNVFMNAVDYAKIRRFVRDTFDPETHRDSLRQGIMGTMWGAQLIITRRIPIGQVYITAESSLIGHLPIRELTVLSNDDPRQRTIGWACTEGVGICCTNPRGVAKITISSDAVESREETNVEEDWMTFSESDSSGEESSEEN